MPFSLLVTAAELDAADLRAILTVSVRVVPTVALTSKDHSLVTLLASYTASHADAALPFTSAKLGALLGNVLVNTYEALPSVRPVFLWQSASTLTDTVKMTRRSAASSSAAVTSKENGMRCVSSSNLEHGNRAASIATSGFVDVRALERASHYIQNSDVFVAWPYPLVSLPGIHV